MARKHGEIFFLCLIVGVTSDSVQQASAPDNEQNLGGQLGEGSYPIDLHETLQSLSYANGEDSENDELPHNSWSALVPGTPGTDYPNLNKIPETSFTCADKTPGGYYADVETGCQVFHICNIGGFKSSFLCPEGSIFNQRHFVCDWWYGFHCNEAISLYPENQLDNDSLNEQSKPLDSPASESIDNYGPIEFSNNSQGDLALASSGENRLAGGVHQERLPKDNQREPLSNEQRNGPHHDEKYDGKLSTNYVNGDEKFHQSTLIHKEHEYSNDEDGDNHPLDYIEETVKNSESYGQKERPKEVTKETDYSPNTKGQELFPDTAPRGFSFIRETRRNAYTRGSQIPSGKSEQVGSTEFKNAIHNLPEGEIRYVPAL